MEKLRKYLNMLAEMIEEGETIPSGEAAVIRNWVIQIDHQGIDSDWKDGYDAGFIAGQAQEESYH